ncbi:arginine--tRNA ligase [Priestia abyssalis]|uniref:arginine--tRNA ligase n=1 Tax=Priestia abyssalis TaxID=1221450 RepID=UPI0009958CF4|nr:arginine--tRNA ligase [Priestia abyssalis]
MLKDYIVKGLCQHVPISEQKIQELLEIPPNEELGDVAFPCFFLAKEWRKSPQLIAQELADNVCIPDVETKAMGPYLNFFFHKGTYGKKLLSNAYSPSFLHINVGQGKRIIIDMSSPNIAKPFGIGHLRSTMIGNALYHLYKKVGYEPVRVNHLGDWGTQFGKQMSAYKRWGNPELIQQDPIRRFFDLYVKFHEEAEKDPALKDEARKWFAKLEKGDKEARELWDYFVRESLKEFKRMYEKLGVEFEYYLGESFYNDKMGAVVEELTEKGLLEESDGAYVVRLDEEEIPPCMILKSDGSTIYATRDLATALYRHDELKGDRLVYVVGAEQSLHFKQVFSVLEKMGRSWARDCEHIPFGLMRLEGKKMSTRRGRVITLEEVLNEAVDRAKELIEEKNPHLQNKEEVAQAMGIGAIIFGDLKHNRLNEVNFSLEEALNFEGDTGPYVQYTYARIQSIKEKSTLKSYGIENLAVISEQYLNQKETWSLLKEVIQYPSILERAAAQNEPSILARYLLDLCKQFNKFYQQNRILVENEQEMKTKLMAAQAVGEIIQDGLSILGLKVPNKM